MTTKPCSECGVPVEGDFSLDGQTLCGLPIVVTATCPACAAKQNAEFVEEEKREQGRRIRRGESDPSEN